MRKRNKPLWWIKWTNYEYWPMFLFYFPTVFYLVYLAIKSRSVTFFTLANPIEEFGSFFGESKVAALEKIVPKYKPASFNVSLNDTPSKVVQNVIDNELSYPIIIKPNWGERGVNVAKINNEAELISYLDKTDRDSIVQEFIDYPIELGVFYYKLPQKNTSVITGIVNKRFLSVVGDGISTMHELLSKNDRARFQIERLRNKFPDLDTRILKPKEELLLEPIGNHNRGTMFLDANDKINDKLVRVFDDVAASMDGFYYGRFDLKVKSWKNLYNGDFRILEVNGVYSEPAHIYDPYKWKILKAYKEIIKHFKIIYIVSDANKKRGYKPSTIKYLWQLTVKNYFQNKQVV